GRVQLAVLVGVQSRERLGVQPDLFAVQLVPALPVPLQQDRRQRGAVLVRGGQEQRGGASGGVPHGGRRRGDIAFAPEAGGQVDGRGDLLRRQQLVVVLVQREEDGGGRGQLLLGEFAVLVRIQKREQGLVHAGRHGRARGGPHLGGA